MMHIPFFRRLVLMMLAIQAALFAPAMTMYARPAAIQPQAVSGLNLKFPFAPGSEWQITAGWEASNHRQPGNWYALDFVPVGRSCQGEAVVAADHGWIDRIDTDGNGAHRVFIRHANNYRSLYVHLASRSPLPEGAEVFHGTQIGVCGRSGNASGEHIHFHMYHGGLWDFQYQANSDIPTPIDGVTDQARLRSGNRGLYSSNRCDVAAVGAGSGRQQMFIDAYNRRGGRAKLGCTRTDAHWWAGDTNSVVVQDFSGPTNHYDVAIIHDEKRDTPSNTTPAYVVGGGIWKHYVSLGGWSSWLGPPTSDEFENPTGQAQSNFRSGYIAWNNGNPQAVAWPSSVSGQWRAAYHNGRNLDNAPTWVENTAAINYDWGAGAPGSGKWGVWADNFSVRWDGRFNFDAGEYTFISTSDDGVRVWVDGTLIIDQWRDQGATEYRATRSLASGPHDIRVEYFDAGSGAVAKFRWERF